MTKPNNLNKLTNLGDMGTDGETTGSTEIDDLYLETKTRIQQAHLSKPEGGIINSEDSNYNQPYQNHRGEWIIPDLTNPEKNNTNSGKSFAEVFNQIKKKKS